MKNAVPFKNALLFSAMLAILPATGMAQKAPTSLADSVRQAVNLNPEVQSRWNAFLAAGHEQEAVEGGFYPKLDLELGIGRDYTDYPNLNSTSYNREGGAVTLSQMLYDGGFTRNEAKRFGQARTVRYFEVLADAENVGLEVVRAYADVLKYRTLLQFAKENFVEHKLVHDQIVERTRSGIGRGVDLDLATGRLALAESNLLTEASNLHDVSARFVRLVGEAPAEKLAALSPDAFAKVLPGQRDEALRNAHLHNPGIRAAVANVRAGQTQVDSRRAYLKPRLDLRIRQDLVRNRDGIDGNSREGVIELLLNYNLYNGGSDQARVRQAAESVNVAWDLREKVCRDVRQTLTIALNDVRSIEEQLNYLDQHQLSIEKARTAYRQQFDIGQRTLLDLLDNENEYFDARRAYASAEHDLIVAQARTLAAMGSLLTTLEVRRDALPEIDDVAEQEDYEDPDTVCPPLAPEMPQIDKDALIRDTLKTVGSKP